MDPISISLIVACLVMLYMYLTRNHSYWRNRNVPYVTPLPLTGNIKPLLMLETPPGPFLESLYNHSQGKNQRYLGFFIFNSEPVLLLRDPDLIKKILVQDFSYFINRNVAKVESDYVGSNILFSLDDTKWKWMRGKLSPVFTSGKIKQMFLLIQDIGKNLEKILDEDLASTQSKDGVVLEFKELISRYTTDVITMCAYGIQANALTDPNSQLRHFGKQIFKTTTLRAFQVRTFFFMHVIAKIFRLHFFTKEGTRFLTEVFMETINMRLEKKIWGHDFIDILIKLKMDYDKGDGTPKKFELRDDDLVANAAVFFTAGFETTATTIMYTMYELALQPEIQEKVRKEIISTLEEEGESSVTYEALSKMKYLDMVVSETLRKHPPMPFIDRVCTKDYNVPDSNLIIKKGTSVYISILGLQHDPKYFPKPDIFDPERFSDENMAEIHPGIYLPFGDGPRICIGMRFALMSVKLALANILRKYSVKSCNETTVPTVLHPRAFLLTPEGGMYLKFCPT